MIWLIEFRFERVPVLSTLDGLENLEMTELISEGC